MPRWEVQDIETNYHPIQIITYILGFFLFGFSLFWVTLDSSLPSILLFMFSISFLIYILGRIYAQIAIEQDFVEITKHHVSFRSTPPFGMGWLPKSGTYAFDQIQKADIVQITPFHDPEAKLMAIQIQLTDGKTFLVGNNLSDEDLIKVGLALKGTVTLSKKLAQLLGSTEDLGDQLKDLAKGIGKSILNNIKDRAKTDSEGGN